MPSVQTADLATAAIEMPGKAKTLSNFVLWATGRSLDKPAELRTSDWEKRPLSADQLAYAALDVLGPVLVIRKLSQQPGSITTRVVEQQQTKERTKAPVASFFGVESNAKQRRCRCGSSTHLRITHHSCVLNPKNNSGYVVGRTALIPGDAWTHLSPASTSRNYKCRIVQQKREGTVGVKAEGEDEVWEMDLGFVLKYLVSDEPLTTQRQI